MATDEHPDHHPALLPGRPVPLLSQCPTTVPALGSDQPVFLEAIASHVVTMPVTET